MDSSLRSFLLPACVFLNVCPSLAGVSSMYRNFNVFFLCFLCRHPIVSVHIHEPGLLEHSVNFYQEEKPRWEITEHWKKKKKKKRTGWRVKTIHDVRTKIKRWRYTSVKIYLYIISIKTCCWFSLKVALTYFLLRCTSVLYSVDSPVVLIGAEGREPPAGYDDSYLSEEKAWLQIVTFWSSVSHHHSLPVYQSPCVFKICLFYPWFPGSFHLKSCPLSVERNQWLLEQKSCGINAYLYFIKSSLLCVYCGLWR